MDNYCRRHGVCDFFSIGKRLFVLKNRVDFQNTQIEILGFYKENFHIFRLAKHWAAEVQ